MKNEIEFFKNLLIPSFLIFFFDNYNNIYNWRLENEVHFLNK